MTLYGHLRHKISLTNCNKAHAFSRPTWPNPSFAKKGKGFPEFGKSPLSQSVDTSLVRLKYKAFDRKIHRVLNKVNFM